MTKIAGVLFDKDGTLFDFTSTWGVWIQRVLNELCDDDPVKVSELANAAGYSTATQEFVTGSLAVNASADETNQVWSELLPDKTLDEIQLTGLRHIKSLPLMPVTDLARLFDSMKQQGLTLGLATNDFESAAYQQLQQSNIESCFDFICGFDSGYGSKPEPGMIAAFCHKAGLDVSTVAMVGDSTHDLFAGRAAGAGLVVGVLTGPATESDLQDIADTVLPDISYLPGYLQNRDLL